MIQILGVDRSYVGGLAFGFTAYDPAHVDSDELPDDSDLLLDRKEYWVVNKDVCRGPEIGDELCFHLTLNGRYREGILGRGEEINKDVCRGPEMVSRDGGGDCGPPSIVKEVSTGTFTLRRPSFDSKFE